jgi:hypothetical protein
VVWGYLASRLRQKWFWGLVTILMIFVPLSRMYLGVHFPTDLLGGYLLGVVILLIGFKFGPVVTEWLGRQPLAGQLSLAVVLPLLMVWLLPTAEVIGVTVTAVWLGMSVGVVLEQHWFGFLTEGSWSQRLLRLLVGLVVVLALRFGLKAAFAGLTPVLLFQFCRYSLIALWITLGAPWLFIKLGLAGSKNKPAVVTAKL